MDKVAQLKQQVRLPTKEVELLKQKRVYQTDIVNDAVKMRHVGEGVRFIRSGTLANRPTTGESPLQGSPIYYVKEGNIFVWDSEAEEWVEFVRVPASPATYTQTFSTADRTHANSTFGAIAETGATQTSPWGYGTEAQANAIPVELNDLGDDVADLKQLVNAVIDDLQSIGLID